MPGDLATPNRKYSGADGNTGNMSPASLFLSHNHKDQPFGPGSESNGSKGVAKRGGNQGRESLIAKVSAAVNEMRYPGVVLSAACGRKAHIPSGPEP